LHRGNTASTSGRFRAPRMDGKLSYRQAGKANAGTLMRGKLTGQSSVGKNFSTIPSKFETTLFLATRSVTALAAAHTASLTSRTIFLALGRTRTMLRGLWTIEYTRKRDWALASSQR